MEVFSLLKFWRNAGASDSSIGDAFSEADFSTSSSYDFHNHIEEEFYDDDSFFDLVFTSPDRDRKRTQCSTTTVKINDDFRRASSKLDCQSPIDVFYKRNSLSNHSESKPQSPISLLKSSPKLRVFKLGFNKSKLVKSQVSCASMATTIEEVPIASLLTRDNSLRAKMRTENLDINSSTTDEPSKRFITNKYLNLIKPLYVKASKRYTDKTRFSEYSPSVTPSASPATVPVLSPMKQAVEKQGSKTTVFSNVSKRLAKSRLESKSVAGKVNVRRDDSVVQQQDGIQGAILHCKRSYNSSAHGCSVLSRSESAPAQGKSISHPRISIDEEKRSSI